MSCTLTLTLTKADDGSPLSGIALREATPEGRILATTDASGQATVALDVDPLDVAPSTQTVLFIALHRFSITEPAGEIGVTLYDNEIYEYLTADQSADTGGQQTWNVRYTFTDNDGNPIAGIPAINPLTGTLLTPEATTPTASAPAAGEYGLMSAASGEVTPTSDAGWATPTPDEGWGTPISDPEDVTVLVEVESTNGFNIDPNVTVTQTLDANIITVTRADPGTILSYFK